MQITKTELKNMITEAVEAALSKRKLSEAKKTDRKQKILESKVKLGDVNKLESSLLSLYPDTNGWVIGESSIEGYQGHTTLFYEEFASQEEYDNLIKKLLSKDVYISENPDSEDYQFIYLSKEERENFGYTN